MDAFLDHNATTPIHRDVLEAMLPWLKGGAANASSTHRPGRESRRAVERAREQVADLIGASSDEIIFTSGGTEANNLALSGLLANQPQGARLAVSAVEHASVAAAAESLRRRGHPLVRLPVNRNCQLILEQARRALQRGVALISVMLANNETGALQPLAELSQLVRARNGVQLHCDAVQAAGKVPFSVAELRVDALSLSAHKIQGPQGVGALYLSQQSGPLTPLLHGGGQEEGLRPGTYNVAGIVGFGRAAELARRALQESAGFQEALRHRLERGIQRQHPEAVILCRRVPRLPNTVSVCFPGHSGAELVAALDQRGVAVSTGAACSGGAEVSHVLLAMGLDRALASGALRFSLGPGTTEEEVDHALAALGQVLPRPLHGARALVGRLVRRAKRSL